MGKLGLVPRMGRAVFLVLTVMMAVELCAYPSFSQASGDAGAFLSEFSKRAMAELNEPGLSEAEKQVRFRALLNEGFDVEAIARFVLGRYWRSASDAERQEFVHIFEDSMVYRFLPLLGDYAGDVLQVQNVRPFGDEPGLFNVESELRRRDGPPIRITWRIYKSARGYRVLDVLAEGVSVAVTLRAEYGSVLQQHGGSVTALTKVLREKIAGT